MVSFIHPNMINEAMNCLKSVKECLVPGIGATMYVGSDRYAMIVIEVLTPKKIKVAHLFNNHEDKLITKNGLQFLPDEYLKEYKKLDNGNDFHSSRIYTLRKNGRWMPQGSGLWDTCSIHIGEAENYRDPSF